MFIKLDNGIMINLNEIAYIDPDKKQAYFKQPVITDKSIYGVNTTCGIYISESDGNRILAATNRVEVHDGTRN